MIFRRRKQEVPRIEVIDLKPGDTLFFQFPQRVPRDVFMRLRTQMKDQLGNDHKLIILEGGATVGVIRGKEEEA